MAHVWELPALTVFTKHKRRMAEIHMGIHEFWSSYIDGCSRVGERVLGSDPVHLVKSGVAHSVKGRREEVRVFTVKDPPAPVDYPDADQGQATS